MSHQHYSFVLNSYEDVMLPVKLGTQFAFCLWKSKKEGFIMHVQGVGNYFVQSICGTHSSVSRAQSSAKSVDATVEDRVTISAEALEMVANGDMEKSTYYEYIHDMSDYEKRSFWSSVESQLKPRYFRGAKDYNINVATKAAEQLVADAKKQGKDIDVDEARVCMERWFGIDLEGSYEEACDMGLIDGSRGLQLELVDPFENLTDDAKAMLENMYNNAKVKGLPTDQVDQIAFHLGMSMWGTEKNAGPTHELTTEFLEHLIDGIDKGAYQGLDATVLQAFIDNFDGYTSSSV
ncbi:MAG: hypothetical protein ABIF87_10310 [Pseudomonadota bacterium]